jgi:hypothetical protein
MSSVLNQRDRPKTREVICVASTGVEEQPWKSEAQKILEHFATQVRTPWLDKLPLQAVLDEVARLPLNSVVLYIPMLRDGAGRRRAKNALRESEERMSLPAESAKAIRARGREMGRHGGRPSLVNEGRFPLTAASLLARSYLLEANNSKTCDSTLRLSFHVLASV